MASEREKPVEHNTSDEEVSLEGELQELAIHDRLRSIIHSVSGDFDLEVTTRLTPKEIEQAIAMGTEPRRFWFYREILDDKTGEVLKKYVHIPEVIMEKHEDFAKGVAAHEAGHVVISRSGRFIPDEVLQELGFGMLEMSSEERPTDQVVRDRRPGAGGWLDYMRGEQAREGELIRESRKTIGYVPKIQQLGQLIVFSPHYEKVPEFMEDDVLELYELMRKDVERMERTIPPEGASEEEVIAYAKQRYRIVYNKMWPKAQELLKEDLEREELRQMADEMLQHEEGEKEEGGEGSLSPEFLEQLKQAIKEQLEQAAEDALNEVDNDGAIEDGDADSGNEGGSGAEDGDESGLSEPSEEESDEGEESEEGEDGPETIPIPMDKLGDELLKAMREAFNELSPEHQKVLQEKARQELERIEDAVVKEFSAKFDEEAPETHSDYVERMAAEQEQREEEDGQQEREEGRKEVEKDIQKDREEIERRQAALQEKRTTYDKAYEEIHSQEEELYRRLHDIFYPSRKRGITLRSAGTKINLPAVYRWESARGAGDRGIDSKIFESVTKPEVRDYAFTILVDLSGSMGGPKIWETFKAVILVCENLNRLSVPFEILGFQDEVITFKKFDEEFNDVVRNKMSGMIAETLNQNPGGHNQASHNDDGPALLEASGSLEKQPAKEKFLLPFSDGSPAGRWSTEDDLHDAVRHVLTDTNQKLVALGIGPNTEHVKRFYPYAIPSINADELTETLAPLLEDMIIRPQHYSYRRIE